MNRRAVQNLLQNYPPASHKSNKTHRRFRSVICADGYRAFSSSTVFYRRKYVNDKSALVHKENNNGSTTQQKHPQMLYNVANVYHESDDNCLICKQRFSPADPLLSSSSRGKRKVPCNGDVCLGCTRYFGPYLHDHEVRTSMIVELVSSYQRNGKFNFLIATNLCLQSDEFYDKIAKKRRGCMVSRRTKLDKSTTLPTKSEIADLIQKSNSTCAISGVPGVWHSTTVLNPFFLTLDHKIPISKGGSLSIDNLQVVLLCINRLKADLVGNIDTKRFLTELVKNYTS